MGDFSHLDACGKGRMVDVSEKIATVREARVSGMVRPSMDLGLQPEALREVLTTARIAGIQAAKRTAELIPYCHTIPLTKVQIDIDLNENQFRIAATAKTQGVTGCEIEAFTAAMIAGLTLYDMIKAKDPRATIGTFQLENKFGGKHGEWQR